MKDKREESSEEREEGSNEKNKRNISLAWLDLDRDSVLIFPLKTQNKSSTSGVFVHGAPKEKGFFEKIPKNEAFVADLC